MLERPYTSHYRHQLLWQTSMTTVTPRKRVPVWSNGLSCSCAIARPLRTSLRLPAPFFIHDRTTAISLSGFRATVCGPCSLNAGPRMLGESYFLAVEHIRLSSLVDRSPERPSPPSWGSVAC